MEEKNKETPKLTKLQKALNFTGALTVSYLSLYAISTRIGLTPFVLKQVKEVSVTREDVDSFGNDTLDTYYSNSYSNDDLKSEVYYVSKWEKVFEKNFGHLEYYSRDLIKYDIKDGVSNKTIKEAVLKGDRKKIKSISTRTHHTSDTVDVTSGEEKNSSSFITASLYEADMSDYKYAPDDADSFFDSTFYLGLGFISTTCINELLCYLMEKKISKKEEKDKGKIKKLSK